MEVRKRNKHRSFRPPFRGSQSPEASSQAGALNVLTQDKDCAVNSEGESCSGLKTLPTGAFELAAAYTKANSENQSHSTDRDADTLPYSSIAPLSKTSRALGSQAKGQNVRNKGSCSPLTTSACKAKRPATSLHGRVLKCPSKLLTQKLAVASRPKVSSVLGLSKKNSVICSLMPGEKSLDGVDDSSVSELGVYDLPPTQPEAASEPHGKLKKTTIGKRNRVLTHEQRLVHKEVLFSFERLCAEIEHIREKYGHVLSDIYSKQTFSKDENELWFECNEE